MYTEQVILTEHKVPWTGTNKFGKPSSLNVFTDTQGKEFSTFDPSIAAQLLTTMGQTVTISFETKPRGDRIDYNIKSVGVAPVANAVPQVAPAQVAPAPSAPPQDNEERQLRIMRQSATERAILAFGAAGLDPVENWREMLEYADSVLLPYFTGGLEAAGAAEQPITVDAGPVA